MGTKANPGKFDCYANAAPDEPMFILLGRDKYAPTLVSLWAALRLIDGEDPAVVAEAMQCAEAMATHSRSLGKEPVPCREVARVVALLGQGGGLHEAERFLRRALEAISSFDFQQGGLRVTIIGGDGHG